MVGLMLLFALYVHSLPVVEPKAAPPTIATTNNLSPDGAVVFDEVTAETKKHHVVKEDELPDQLEEDLIKDDDEVMDGEM